jgi:glycosyltransferase involved in cell wall biosynthesis
MPRCSVVIPAYNVEEFVTEAVSSALGQTFADIEVIVVNDGSSDETAAVLEPLMERIVYLEQPNRGLAAARNRGVQQASGEFVAFLDADDFWMPRYLQRMVGLLESRPDLALVTTDSLIVKDNLITGETFYGRFPRRRRFRHHGQSYWITQYNFVHMAVSRTETVHRLSGFEESLRACEDWDLWLRMLASGERAGFVEGPLAYYRIRPEALSADLARALADQATMLDLALGRSRAAGLPGLPGRAGLARARLAALEGRDRAARRLFGQAARDRALPGSTRLGAAAFAAAPAAWRRYVRRESARAHRT